MNTRPVAFQALFHKSPRLQIYNVARAQFPTTTPEETLGKVSAWLDAQEGGFDALGSSGPIDPREGSPAHGQITTTPKPARGTLGHETCRKDYLLAGAAGSPAWLKGRRGKMKLDNLRRM